MYSGFSGYLSYVATSAPLLISTMPRQPLSIARPPVAPSHLATLDGLRGIAALAVLTVHILLEMHWVTSTSHMPLQLAVPHVHLAVDFFFMLSGFVIAKAYESQLTTVMSPSRFMLVRLFRLYPLIFMGAMLGTLSLAARVVIMHTLSFGQLLTASLSALVLAPTTALVSAFPGQPFPVNFPQWSLLFELVINFIYAATVKWMSTARLIVVCALSLVALCLVASASSHLLDVGMGLNPIGIIPADIWCGIIRVTFPFYVGILLFRRRLSYNAGDITSVGLTVVLLAVLFAPVFRHSWVYEVVAVAIIFPAIIVMGATCHSGPRLTKIWLYLGELSYPLYITHNPVSRIVINTLMRCGVVLPHWVVAGVTAVAAVLAAVVLLKVWDEPVRRWLARHVTPPHSYSSVSLRRSTESCMQAK